MDDVCLSVFMIYRHTDFFIPAKSQKENLFPCPNTFHDSDEDGQEQ